MSRDKCTEASFLKDVQHHQMTIIRDNGVHRHIRFSKPRSFDQHFDLLTWPGYLCYTGDMGTYVFRRLEDMFQFFRRPDGLGINPGYWSEKLESVDRADGFEEYSEEKFRRYFADYLDEGDASPELREAVEEEILYRADDGEDSARRAAHDFTWEGRNPFEDFYEVSTSEYTLRFLWCCHAIVWGINQYDQEREKLTAASKRDGDEWPGGLVWTIGGIKFVEFEDALGAIRTVEAREALDGK